MKNYEYSIKKALSHAINVDKELDDEVLPFLEVMNRNQSLHTMLSKLGGKGRAFRNPDKGFRQHSYLKFCYTENVKPSIDQFFDKLKAKWEVKEATHFDSWNGTPYRQPEPNPFHPFLDHPEYWNVEHLIVELGNGDKKKHFEFWDDLSGLSHLVTDYC